jgi:hypothetical protein
MPNFGHHFKRAHYPNYKRLLTQVQLQIQGGFPSNILIIISPNFSLTSINTPITVAQAYDNGQKLVKQSRPDGSKITAFG